MACSKRRSNTPKKFQHLATNKRILAEFGCYSAWTSELTVFFSGCYRHGAGRGSSVVEQPIRNRQVASSTLALGSSIPRQKRGLRIWAAAAIHTASFCCSCSRLRSLYKRGDSRPDSWINSFSAAISRSALNTAMPSRPSPRRAGGAEVLCDCRHRESFLQTSVGFREGGNS